MMNSPSSYLILTKEIIAQAIDRGITINPSTIVISLYGLLSKRASKRF